MPPFLADPGNFWSWLSDCFPKTLLLQARSVASHAVYSGYGEQNILFLCVIAFVSEDKSVGNTWILYRSLSRMPENRINCRLDPLLFCAACQEGLLCPHLRNLHPIHMYIPLLQSDVMEDILCCNLGTGR